MGLKCYTRVWVKQELWGGGPWAHRSILFTQPKNGFRRPALKTGTKLHKSSLTPPVKDLDFHESSRSLKKLFSGCAFGTAAIWQYEHLRTKFQNYFENAQADWLDRIQPQKGLHFRKQINLWWNSLSNGQRAVSGIIAANVFVFCLWRIPALSRIMVTYFTSNPASRVLCFPMLLSTFSHFSFLHMVANMYVLWSFSTSIVSILGREQFMAVYLSAGVVSTFVSYVCKMATGKFGPSLGASGAIMAVLGAVCTKIPEAKLAIIFLPMFTFTAGNALKAIIALDSVGLILGWRWYVMYGNKLIWNNREPVVKAWHTVKTWRPNK
ncbi:Presenilins-associated rhomboid-like protein, mitochondrial [Ophiophagus hannah]|uniref:rhomboid protease n=1 Tax=Ophiophagus hannah TaxID=8665 RepID=V8PFH9_OPHHA|nr:Presenilins-associated rhomboid-like protein, mitochondrial [Ophiophagus hannah]